MIRRKISKSIPIDLIIEILARLPAKSIARLRCMSKLWGSMFLRPHFTELFLTMSLARPPRLLFAVKRLDGYWCFFTSPQPQNPYATPSLVVTAEFQIKFPGDKTCIEFCGFASGLIYFCQTEDPVTVPVMICNPSTGQYTSLSLPLLEGRRLARRFFLGFDPIDRQFKVLSIPIPLYNDQEEEANQILTLGVGNDSWRKIHCPLMKHVPIGEGICIKGVLYYFAERNHTRDLLVCFNVRSEKFKFINIGFSHHVRVVNYKGKLGVITLEHVYNSADIRHPYELCMWVIEDDEKPEWSKYFSFRWDDEVTVDYSLSIVGVTATGEIVLSKVDVYNEPDYVYFLSLERKTLQSVEIQGFSSDDYSRVVVFPDHVEDLTFINT